ncbi:MAG: sigma-70 family RNA polymerase sigma factor [Microbacterium sp.]
MSDADPVPARQSEGEGDAAVPFDGETGDLDGTVWDRAAEHFARWQAGDARAIDDLIRLLTPVLWHVVRAYGLDTMLAEDVVQTTWLTLVRRHESIHEPRAVAGWLTTTARREAWRAGRTHRRDEATEAADLEPRLPPQGSAEGQAQRNDRDRRLWSAVDSLDERCRRLLRIVAFEERPDYARIGRDLNMPIGSIGPTRQRCLGKLRSALDPMGDGLGEGGPT